MEHFLLIFSLSTRILEGAMTENELRNVLNQELARFFGDMTRHLSDEMFDIRREVQDTQADINKLRTVVDGIAVDTSDIKDEIVIQNHQIDRRLERHERWFKQLADHSHVELDPQL